VQNRYVADVGDFVKFSILRELIGEPPRMRVGVAWWLFPDEDHNRDGGHRQYLRDPDKWRRFDPVLFDALKKINDGDKLDVLAIQKANLFQGARFAPDLIPCDLLPYTQRPLERKRWFSKVKDDLKGCDLVFLDPDNGIASDGLRLTLRRAGKSVTLEEIAELAENRATVVYHHQTHRKGGHRDEIPYQADRLRKYGLRVTCALRARPGSSRFFFILNGDAELQKRAKGIAERWKGEDKIAWHSCMKESVAQPD
jgi:hypothetical protein